MKLSVIVPSIRPANLQRLYESIVAAYTGEFEFIVVGPHPMPEWFADKPHVIYVKDYGSPVRAQQLGVTHARGDYVLWGVADDGAFLPGSIDAALRQAAPDTVVVGKYYEGTDNPAMTERKYYYINTHDCCRSAYIENDWLMFMVGIIPTRMLMDIGGVDASRFETLPMAFNDLSARLYRAGVKLGLTDNMMFRCTHMPGHEGDHGPVHDGQTLHDEPEFRKIYNNPDSVHRVRIPLNNWFGAPTRWWRRFGTVGGPGRAELAAVGPRILFISSSTNETTKYAQGLACLSPSAVAIMRYDTEGFNEAELFQKAYEFNPRFIVYIGSRWPPQVSIATLCQLNAKVAPMAHVCSDAGDLPWHDLLLDYHYAGAFAVQVAIDGNPNWPGAKRGLTLLTPVDPMHFQDSPPHTERQFLCGFAGNPGAQGSPRREFLAQLAPAGLVHHRWRDEGADSYAEYCRYLQQCRVSLNLNWTGSGAAFHVKGRVVETGLAGGCLLEPVRSPTAAFFTPGEDYLEFASAQEVVDHLKRVADHPEITEEMGARLRAKVLANHTPLAFWTQVCDKMGIKV